MSKEIYDMGYSAGRACALANLSAVRDAKYKATLHALAGKKLESIQKREKSKKEEFFVNTESWSTGFFDGFIDRSGEL